MQQEPRIMKKAILIILIYAICSFKVSYGQEKMEVEGAIIINNSEDSTPAPGTIRFNSDTNDFEGWNGHQWMSFTRLREPGGGVTDADGNTYSTVKLGTQEWMVENLKTTKYNDNTGIPNITGDIDWQGLNTSETGAWCYYDNNSSNNVPYGKLYNWYAVNTGKLCPTGWHLPTDAEWTTLIDYLDSGVDPNALGSQSTVAGGPMKEAGTTHWFSPNTGATNESGFTGLPGGLRSDDGTYFSLGYSGNWWSSTESGTFAWCRYLFYDDDNVFRNNFDKRLGFSIRCVRD